jgi:hypothetical protein
MVAPPHLAAGDSRCRDYGTTDSLASPAAADYTFGNTNASINFK